MIRIEELAFEYASREFQLRIPHLTIPQGQKVAIVGPSGCGKSTLLSLVAGAFLPERGTIQVNETHLNRLSDAQRRKFRVTQVGFIFQDFELIDYLTVRENILLPYLINGSLRIDQGVRQRLDRLVTTAGIRQKLKRRPEAMSQGERQRVAVCRALITNPRLILADEPTGSLDPHTGGEVLQLILDQTRSLNATLLMVTHDYSQLSLFDRTLNLLDIANFKPDVESVQL